jgi:NitT/TauT family transport system substrate-binding protein
VDNHELASWKWSGVKTFGQILGTGVVAVLLLAGGASAENLKLRVGVIPVLGSAPLFVAEKEGWLHDAGLDPSVTFFDSGPNMIQAAASGNIDVYVGGVAPVATGRSKGIDLRVVTATAIDENVLVAGAKLKSFFKPGVAPAAAFNAFRLANGRPAKIATQPLGSVPSANLQYWLREVTHTDPADVDVISVGIDATQRALLASAVDAAIVREPALTIVQQRNPEITILAKGEDLFPGQPGTVVAVSGALIEKNPQAVQALVNGIVRAIDELQKAPDRAAPLVEASLSKGLVDTATIRASLSSPAVHYVADPKVIVEATKALLAFQVKIGALDKAPPADGLFDPRFYEKAVKP